jgi:hypothetical protein
MLKSFGRLAMLAMSLMLLAVVPANAGQVRFPASASPAFTMTAPDGWRIANDGVNYQVFASDNSGFIQLTMVSAPDLAQANDDDLAAIVFKSAGLPPFSRKAPVTIDGHGGTAYFASTVLKDTPLTVRVVLIRLGANGLAVITDAHIGAPTGGPVDAVLATIRIAD